MPHLPRRMALLAEGRLSPLDAKTAVGVLRYRSELVVAVVDRGQAGRTAGEVVGAGGNIPIVPGLDEAAALGANAVLVGVAPQGGELPVSWRALVSEALRRGWDVMSGLHVFLAEDREFAELARLHGGRILDARRPPAGRPVAARRAEAVNALVVQTVGSDCNVGKMTTALELTRALESGGTRAAFVATGQTGIFVADSGVAVDAVAADFVAGFAEELVVQAAGEADVVVVEGQGSLFHPAYSGVTLALLHGACPEALVLCHAAGRERVRTPGRPASPSDPAIPSLDQIARTYEAAAAWVHPARVVAISLNTLGLEASQAQRAVEEAARRTGLPVTDPIRFGTGPLRDAVEAVRPRGARRGSRD